MSNPQSTHPSSPIPKIDLTTFILSVSSTAFMALGLTDTGQSGSTAEVDLTFARQNIDVLEMIQEKTKGNRTPDEDRLLEQLLFETRMKFVEISQKKKA